MKNPRNFTTHEFFGALATPSLRRLVNLGV
jgi:hypothetical protein